MSCSVTFVETVVNYFNCFDRVIVRFKRIVDIHNSFSLVFPIYSMKLVTCFENRVKLFENQNTVSNCLKAI